MQTLLETGGNGGR